MDESDPFADSSLGSGSGLLDALAPMGRREVDGVTLEPRDGVMDFELLRDLLEDRVSDVDTDMVGVIVGVLDTDFVTEAVREMLGVMEAVTEMEGVTEAVLEIVGVLELDNDVDPDWDGLKFGVSDADLVMDRLVDKDFENEAETEFDTGDFVFDAVLEPVRVLLPVMLVLLVLDSEREGVRVSLGLFEGDRDTLGVFDELLLTDCEALARRRALFPEYGRNCTIASSRRANNSLSSDSEQAT